MTKTLLDHVRTLVEAEQGLTDALEKCLPLLHHERSFPSSTELLPTPRDPSEVPAILALARAYSLRTSAPPTWNPNLPVIGFATPNPLPHHLRGGALGAMQLKMAQEEKNRKGREAADRRERERQREEEDAKKRGGKGEEGGMDVDVGPTAGKKKRGESVGGEDPRKDAATQRQGQLMARRAAPSGGRTKKPSAEEYQKKKEAANMNLSDSSSSEEESGDDDSD